MGRDEVGTLRTLTAYRVIIDRLIASHRGRIFNTAGDSLPAAEDVRVRSTRRSREMDSNFGFRASGDTPQRPRVKPQAAGSRLPFRRIDPPIGRS